MSKRLHDEILLPSMLDNLDLLKGREPNCKGLELFHSMELLDHQVAMVNSVTQKIKASRNVEKVFGYAEKEFNYSFLSSEDFVHKDDLEASLYLMRMALFNELKKPSGSLKVEYGISFRIRHKTKGFRLVRYNFSAYGTILHGIPTTALIVMSDLGSSNIHLPAGLSVNRRSPFVVDSSTGRLKRSDVPFTKREREVLYGICMGESSKMIADRFDIAKKTVDNLRAKLLQKSGTANTAELATKAVLYSWV